MGLGTGPEDGFWMDDFDGRGLYCSFCCGRGSVTGFQTHHAGSFVFCFC